jgi:hypothetical protein
MRSLQITFFILFFVTLSSQSFRHVYIKFIEPKNSILDEFKSHVEKDIDSSQTLIELKELFAKAKAKYDTLDNKNDSSFAGKANLEKLKEDKNKIENIISYREGQNKKIFEIWFFWSMGLLSLLIGCVVYRKINNWIGIASIITGFTEMIWWTKPSFRSFGKITEFELLLNIKVLLSIVTLTLLTTLWLLFTRSIKKIK